MSTLFDCEPPAVTKTVPPRAAAMDPRCPSEAGYQAHQKRGEKPCDGCRDARNATRRAREAAKPKPWRPDRTPTRFWSKVSGGDFTTCWEWTASRDLNGYGRFSVGGRAGQMENAHRVAYRMLVADIPEGCELDHLCRNRACVNPWHLDPVPHAINSRRGIAGQVNAARQRAITHCPAGHPYDAENTTYRPGNGARRCKACAREEGRRRYAADPPKGREIARRYRARKAAA